LGSCKKFLEKNPDNRASLESPEQVAQFLAHPGAALLEVVCDIEQIMAATTLSALRPKTVAIHAEVEIGSA
jgi:hypothetical protein